MTPPKSRRALFDPQFLEDLSWWVGHDHRVAIRVLRLVQEVIRDPLRGIGKPEPLKHHAQGTHSRRITREHRLVYRAVGNEVHFLQARHHY